MGPIDSSHTEGRVLQNLRRVKSQKDEDLKFTFTFLTNTQLSVCKSVKYSAGHRTKIRYQT
jgi:hypothetical protein